MPYPHVVVLDLDIFARQAIELGGFTYSGFEALLGCGSNVD